MACAALLAAGCGRGATDRDGGGTGTVPPPIDEVLARHSAAWMSVPGVVGTGVGVCDGERCIKVFVVERTGEIERRVPSEVDGYPVQVEVTGRVRRRR